MVQPCHPRPSRSFVPPLGRSSRRLQFFAIRSIVSPRVMLAPSDRLDLRGQRIADRAPSPHLATAPCTPTSILRRRLAAPRLPHPEFQPPHRTQEGYAVAFLWTKQQDKRAPKVFDETSKLPSYSVCFHAPKCLIKWECNTSHILD